MKMQEHWHRAAGKAEDAAELMRRGWEDIGRRLRQKMRVYPRTSALPAASASLADEPLPELPWLARNADGQPESGNPFTHADQEPSPVRREETRRKPIISINGKDVDEGELDRSAA